MAIVRTYLCDECGERFDKLHFDRAEPPPECPICLALRARQVPSGFVIAKSEVSKAVDITQDIMEKDLGFTNFKDNLREGDTAAPNLPPNLQQHANNFWKPEGGIIQAARQGAAMAEAEGSNPLRIVQRSGKSRGSTHKVPAIPIARA